MNLAAPALPRMAGRSASAETGWLLVALGAAVAVRALSTPAAMAALGGAALAAGWRPARPTVRAVGWGLAGAVILVAGPASHLLASRTLLDQLSRHGRVGFLPWGAAVAVVVVAEEAFLRGALWRACERHSGPLAALAVTSLGFALLHLPTYGWSALPLDTVVGALLGGLRLASRSVAAPAIAHLLADWAGWWLL